MCESGLPANGDRLHTCVEGRYITIFRHNNRLSAIDSVCHHAGGPLTLGPLQDIEELGMTGTHSLTLLIDSSASYSYYSQRTNAVVLCPWHHFRVSITDGVKAYQGVDLIDGKPVPTGWKTGKMVQRAHVVREDHSGVYVTLVITDEECVSDKDACDTRCMQKYPMHSYPVTHVGHK